MRWWRRRRVYVDDLPETHDGRFLALFLLVFVTLLAAVYVVGYAVAGDRVPTGTTVVSVDVGGMSRDAARTLLDKEVGAKLDEPLSIRAGTARGSLIPSAAGVSFDADATLDDAMGGADWNPEHMLKVVQGGGDVDPVLRVDQRALRAALGPLAAKVSVAPVNATVSVASSRPVVHRSRAGQRLDLRAAWRPIVSTVQQRGTTASLPLASVDPALDSRAAREYVEQTLRPALSGPVTVMVDGAPVKVAPEQFGPALRVTTTSTGLQLHLAVDGLFARTAGVLRSAPGRPVDARITFHGDRPVVVPSRPGTVVDKQVWATAVLTAATSSDRRRSVAPARKAAPAFTTGDAKALHIEVPVSSSSIPAGVGDPTALRTAVSRLNGTVVLPGATFSYVHAAAPGGASALLTPLATATEDAARSGAMTVTERPAGPRHDLRFRNGGVYPVLVRSWLTSEPGGRPVVHVQLWSSRAGF